MWWAYCAGDSQLSELIKASKLYDFYQAELDEAKDNLEYYRQQMLEEANKEIKNTYRDLDNPDETAWSWTDEDSGLTWRKVVAFGYTLDIERLRAEHPDLAAKILTEVVTYKLDEKAAQKLAKSDPEIFAVLQGYTIRKDASIRLYHGKVAKAEDY